MKFWSYVCLWVVVIELALTPLTSHPEKWHVFDLVVAIVCCVCGLTLHALDEKRARAKSDGESTPAAFRQ